MFSGIIRHLGKVKKITFGKKLFIDSSLKSKTGDSIAVDGICLTVSRFSGGRMVFDIMPSTLKKTTLGILKLNQNVNLETALTLNTLIGGHLVSGHVDGVGRVRNIKIKGNSRILTIISPKKLSRFIAEKGSISVNGVSLTILDVKNSIFSVSLVPYTCEHTNLGELKKNSKVNLEVDLIARYLEKLNL